MKESLGLSENFTKFEDGHKVITSLLQKVAAKDSSALSTLYDITSSQVYGMICHLVKDPFLAEEVLSDIYLYVWHNANKYNPERGKPITWLFILARCRALDRLRLRKVAKIRNQNTPLTDNIMVNFLPNKNPSPEENFLNKERQMFIQQALAQLPVEQREAIELAYYLGFSHKEIAEETNQPVGTVKTRIRIGTGKLKELLKPLIEDNI